MEDNRQSPLDLLNLTQYLRCVKRELLLDLLSLAQYLQQKQSWHKYPRYKYL